VVHKSDDGSVTASAVREVAGDERLRELARMMGGGTSEAGLEHARVLLAEATTRRRERHTAATEVAPARRAGAAKTRRGARSPSAVAPDIT
jgi:hypothetical protein